MLYFEKVQANRELESTKSVRNGDNLLTKVRVISMVKQN